MLRKIQVATFDKSMWQAEKFEGDESAVANCHALLPSLSGWSRPQWNIWTSQITPQLDVCESKWNIWTLMIAEISSLLLTHQDWWWLTYFANPICQFHISLYPLMIRGTQWWWRIWRGWWKDTSLTSHFWELVQRRPLWGEKVPRKFKVSRNFQMVPIFLWIQNAWQLS